MAKSKKTEAAAQADVPVPTTVKETAPVAIAVPAETPKRKLRKTKADPAPAEPMPNPAPPPTVKTALDDLASKSKRKPKSATTLATIFAGYLQALDERGGSTGTIASYRMELDLAGKALGIDNLISVLTDSQVAAYFESDPVTRKRNGKPKSPLSIDKTRRVLRQALVWAGHADLVPSVEVAS